jgi:hypothetical protein
MSELASAIRLRAEAIRKMTGYGTGRAGEGGLAQTKHFGLNGVHLSVVGSGVGSRLEQVERACLN